MEGFHLQETMELGKQKGIKDIELKVYKADWDEHFSSKETDNKKIITGFNKEFKTSFTESDISTIEILDSIENWIPLIVLQDRYLVLYSFQI